MKTASVSDLKARLSNYLRVVKRGGEVEVLERGVPIARLVGVQGAAGDPASRVARLQRAGVLTPGRGDLRKALRNLPLRLGAAGLRDALDEDRADRV